MGCLDSLQANVAAILVLLQSKKDCCDDSITYNTQTIITTTITPGIGDPPATWGDGETITTWEDWEEYVCYHAHKYVDKLIEHAETLHAAVAIGAVGIGTVGAILAGLTFVGLAIPVAWLIAAGIAAAAFYFAEDIFEDTATDIETARSSIVCAFILGLSVSDAVDDALSSGQDWLQFFQHIDYDTASAIIHEGGYDGEYLESETREDCTACEFPYNFDISYDFTSSAMGWVLTTFVYDGGDGSLSGQVSSATCIAGKTIASLLSDIGHSGASKLEINYLEAEYRNYQVASPPTNVKNRMRRPDTSLLEFPHTVPDNGVDHVHIDVFPDEELGANVEFLAMAQAGGGDQFVFLDNLRIRGWVTD